MHAMQLLMQRVSLALEVITVFLSLLNTNTQPFDFLKVESDRAIVRERRKRNVK
jgi:hypothetical protein